MMIKGVLFGLVLVLLSGCNCTSTDDTGEIDREKWEIPAKAERVVDLGNYWFCFELPGGTSYLWYWKRNLLRNADSCPIIIDNPGSPVDNAVNELPR